MSGKVPGHSTVCISLFDEPPEGKLYMQQQLLSQIPQICLKQMRLSMGG